MSASKLVVTSKHGRTDCLVCGPVSVRGKRYESEVLFRLRDGSWRVEMTRVSRQRKDGTISYVAADSILDAIEAEARVALIMHLAQPEGEASNG